jgi:hypothetical protein
MKKVSTAAVGQSRHMSYSKPTIGLDLENGDSSVGPRIPSSPPFAKNTKDGPPQRLLE